MKKTLCLLLVFVLLLPFFGCQKKTDDTKINIYTLNGTTGFGMAKLIVDSNLDEGSNYSFTVKTDASDVLAALNNKDADIAALPTNAAANLYQKTNGGIKILAINTLGCLYLISTDGIQISSLSELEGQTVYTPAQNPAFLFEYLCKRENVNVTIESTAYAQPALLKDAVASGAVKYAVLPEPMATIAIKGLKTSKGATAATLNLTNVWDSNAEDAGKLVQGCLVVRTEFLKEHPDAVVRFLEVYKESVNYVADENNVETASKMIVDSKIFENAAIAKIALPNCNVHFMAGEEMKTAMQSYLKILYGINPATVGGKMPDDDFYYIQTK